MRRGNWSPKLIGRKLVAIEKGYVSSRWWQLTRFCEAWVEWSNFFFGGFLNEVLRLDRDSRRHDLVERAKSFTLLVIQCIYECDYTGNWFI